MRAYPVDMMADSAAMRISQASASASPAPAAGPGSAANVGFLTATSAPVSVRCLVRRSATRSSKDISVLFELLRMAFTSPPAQKALPAPIISNAPTSESSPHCLIIRRSAGVRRSDSALRASGRLSVINATRSRISHNNSAVPVSSSIRFSAMPRLPSDPAAIVAIAARECSSDLQRRPALDTDQSCQPLQNEALGVRHDPIDQLLDRWNVVDQASHHAATPGSRIHVAVDHDLGIDTRNLIVDVFDLKAFASLTFDLEQTIDALILENALGVAYRPHHKARIQFGCSDQRLLDVVVHRRLLG